MRESVSGASWAGRQRWLTPLVAVAVGAALVLARLPLQPILGSAAPFILAWPAIMLAAFVGGFWPAITVTVLGLGVGQFALDEGGAARLGPGGALIFLAFGLVFAIAGAMRKRGLRRARAHAERLSALQAQLMNLGRLNAMGEMAGTLAHELNQPLTAISSYTGAARRLIDQGEAPSPRISELLDKAGQQAVRAREIIGRIRSQVGAGDVAFEAASLSEVIEEAVEVAMAGWGAERVTVRIDLAAAVDRVIGHRIQIQQVLLNLIRNAGEAMAASPRREIVIASRPSAEDLVEISVSDTGPGIAPELAGRLFQPFVTGKADGMGVGLSISRNIVEAHGGKLWADVGGSGGATFRLTLRLAQAGGAPATQVAEDATP